ncbi:MAG: hypothetical protein WBQ43_04760 [Terriglobales bacterium]
MAAQGASLRALVEADILLRALLRRAELDDPVTAFFMRSNERDTGLSVNFDMTPDECRAQFRTSHGVRSLLVQSVRELELEVIPDDAHHANVKGIPHKDDDPDRAELLAGQLLKISQLVSEGLVKNG